MASGLLGVYGDDFFKQYYEIDLTVGGGDNAAKLLQSLFDHMRRLGVGSDKASAAVKSFLSSLGELGAAGALTGKTLAGIEKNMKAVMSVLNKNGYGGFGNLAKEALGAQSLAIGGTSQKDKEARLDLLERFDVGDGTPRFQRILRVAHSVKTLTSAVHSFLAGMAKTNRELLLLSHNAHRAVKEIASMGGALEAYGGSKGEAANFARSFDVEYAKMRRGQGVGGKYMEAARLYGIKYDPKDFASFEREIVKFLSDPSRSRFDKLGLQNTLGLTKEQVSRYSRGLAEFDKENARQKDFTKNTEEMTNASDEYLRSVQHLKAAYEDMRAMVMIPLLSATRPVLEKLADFTRWMRDNPIGKVVGLFFLVGVAALHMSSKVAQLLMTLRMAGLIGGGTAGGGGGNGLGKVLGFGKGAALGLGKRAGAIGATVALFEGGARAFSAYSSGKTAEGNKAIGEGIGGAAGAWGLGKLGSMIGTMIAPGIGTAIGGLLGSVVGYIGGEWLGGKLADGANNLAGVDDTLSRADAMQVAYLETIARNTAARSGAAPVSIDNISISVDGGGSDPVEIANAVRQNLLAEMRSVIINSGSSGRA